jgi:hypothetical protein
LQMYYLNKMKMFSKVQGDEECDATEVK